MKNYEIEKLTDSKLKVKVYGKNKRRENISIEINRHAANSSNETSTIWYTNKLTPRKLDSWLTCDIKDSQGRVTFKYNPTVKLVNGGEKMLINFKWIMEDTPNNIHKLINECIRRFEMA